MTQWKKLLKTLGFTESEALIYLSSIELGPAPVQDLAKKANVSRVTTYAVIESLSERGLMSSVEKGKKKLFVAESPERLVSFVQSRVQEMSATLKEVESSMQELRLLQKGEKPVVKLFEGAEALQAIQNDLLLTKPTETLEFGNYDAIDKLHPSEKRTHFFRELDKIKSQKRSIYLTRNPRMEENPTAMHGLRILPESFGDFFGDIYVYDNKIALSTLRGKQISVLIESADLADTFRAFFNYTWSLPHKK